MFLLLLLPLSFLNQWVSHLAGYVRKATSENENAVLRGKTSPAFDLFFLNETSESLRIVRSKKINQAGNQLQIIIIDKTKRLEVAKKASVRIIF